MSITFKKNLFVTLPLFLWSATILVLTSLPAQEMPEINLWNWDKLAHCFVYLVLAVLVMRYLLEVRGYIPAKALKLCIIIGAAFGGIDEVHQFFIPGRSCAWQDFIADFIGVLFGGYMAFRYFRRKQSA